MRSYRSWFLSLLIGAVLVHAVVLIAAHWQAGAIDGYAFRSLDGKEYYAIARNLVEHGAFSQSEGPPLTPDTWRTPGYPLLLAGVMLFFGKSAASLVLMQQVLSVVNVLLVFHIARMHMPDSRAAFAAALFLVEPYHLFYSLWLLSTTWLVTLLLLTWLAWSRAIRSRQLRWFAILGGLCGFLVLTWPGTILIPLAMFIGVIVEALHQLRIRSALGRRVHGAAVVLFFALACSAVVGVWMMRNVKVAGHFSLSHQSGIVLAYFKATEVALWRQERTEDRYLETSLSPDQRDEPHPTWIAIDEALQRRLSDLSVKQRNELTWPNLAQGNRTSVDSFRISSALRSIAIEQLLESPMNAVSCYFARFGSILTFPLDIALWPPRGVEVNRVRTTALGLLYALLCAAVAIRLLRHRVGFEAVYFPLACTLALLLTTTPQTDPRFRVPMMPLLIFVALLPIRRTIREDPAADRRASTTNESGTQKESC